MAPESDSTILTLLQLAEARTGLALRPYIRSYGESWSSNPMGFHFQGVRLDQLYSWLTDSRSWGRDAGIGALFQKDRISFREISTQKSLHLLLPKKPEDPCTLHLDSVSPVRGRESDGTVKYSSKLVEHVAVDLWHWKRPDGWNDLLK